MKRFAYLFLGLAALASSCKKDSTETVAPAASPKVALLVGKRWALTALTGQQGSVIADGYTNLEACEKDNFLRFNDDRTAVLDEGTTLCTPGDPRTYPGTWELVANDTKLLLTTPLFGTGFAGTPDIVELTATRLVLRALVIQDGVSTTYTGTFAPL